MNSIYAKGRDNARTPMQWSYKENASFTKGIPWLKSNENNSILISNYKEENKLKEKIQLRPYEVIVYSIK